MFLDCWDSNLRQSDGKFDTFDRSAIPITLIDNFYFPTYYAANKTISKNKADSKALNKLGCKPSILIHFWVQIGSIEEDAAILNTLQNT